MPIINKKNPCLSLSLVPTFETVNYMVILITAGRISHIYLIMGPIFLFLFEVHLMGRMSQETHFGKHYKVGGEKEDSG